MIRALGFFEIEKNGGPLQPSNFLIQTNWLTQTDKT